MVAKDSYVWEGVWGEERSSIQVNSTYPFFLFNDQFSEKTGRIKNKRKEVEAEMAGGAITKKQTVMGRKED